LQTLQTLSHSLARPWALERGTLWALEPAEGLPAPCEARLPVIFQQLEEDEIDALATAMQRPGASQMVQERLAGNRRCFVLKHDEQIVTYGWVTHGPEGVGELERRFNLLPTEAYIWDCVTLPQWRGQRLYSALLSELIYRLHDEGAPRIWIGASRENEPSVRGFVNAGFKPVLDLVYRRLLLLTVMWLDLARPPRDSLVQAAQRLLVNEHEHRLGRLVVGFRGAPYHG
jgi:GNAT superfamily N-acetyltransferase